MAAVSKLIVNADGRPMPRAQTSYAHAAADRLSQELASWNPPLRSADSAWLPERDTVAARVQDLARNNGWASGAMQRFVDQAIGANFRLSYRPDYLALGLDADWARDFRRSVEARFRQFAEDPRCYCDAAERQPLSGLLGLAFRQRLVDGEALAVAHWFRRPDTPWATAIQMVDPDRLSTPAGRIENERLRGGVELDPWGAPRAYHIRAAHPGDAYDLSGRAFRWLRIPRKTPHGRVRVVHFFEPERAGQTRGKSLLTPVIERLQMEHRYSRIELQAALVNAVFAAFIESPMDHTLLEEALDTGVSAYQKQRADFHEDRRLTLDGVRIPTLFPGEKFNFSTAARPHAAFGDFERAVLRYIAAAIGQSYEQLAQDWSQTNYSSARAALLESWKFLTARRDAFAGGFARQIFALWLEEEFDSGALDLPDGAPGFWEAFPAWTRCRWIGPGRGWVDPTKEAQAGLMRMDALVSTLEDEAAEQGKDWEEILEQAAHERARKASLGLPETTWTQVEETAASDPDAADREERRQADDGADALARTVTRYERRMAALRARNA